MNSDEIEMREWERTVFMPNLGDDRRLAKVCLERLLEGPPFPGGAYAIPAIAMFWCQHAAHDIALELVTDERAPEYQRLKALTTLLANSLRYGRPLDPAVPLDALLTVPTIKGLECSEILSAIRLLFGNPRLREPYMDRMDSILIELAVALELEPSPQSDREVRIQDNLTWVAYKYMKYVSTPRPEGDYDDDDEDYDEDDGEE